MFKSLFIEYINVQIPDYVDFREELAFTRRKKSLALLMWPSGKPCALANLWLFEVASSSTGQTTRQYSVNLSFYLKFLYDNFLEFSDTSDSTLHDLAKILVTERKTKDPGLRKRNNNRVKAIILTIIDFLKWYQKNISLQNEQPIIGTAEIYPKVTIEPFINSVTGRLSYTHSSIPTDVPPEDDKHAISNEFIDLIEDEISKRWIKLTKPATRLITRLKPPERVLMCHEYLYARRVFMNWAMKNTGLRPGELVQIPVELHSDIYTTRDLQIPTLKRRTEKPPIRHFRITVTGCGYISRYLKARSEFIDGLFNLGVQANHQDAFFLTENATPLSSTSMTKDFSRLTQSAGLGDEKVCLSMYRHRFITLEILIHLRQILKTETPQREMLSDIVIKAICEKIRKKIGHGSPRSMWHYFDAAFNATEYWGTIDAALNNITALDDIRDEVVRLNHAMLRDGASDQMLESIASLRSRFDEILGRRGK